MRILFCLSILMVVALTTQAQTKQPKTDAPARQSGGKSKKSVNAAFIVGTWNLMPMPTGDGMSQDQTWTFTKNFFAVEGYPELKQKGMYKVMKEKGDTLFVKLYKQEGHWGTEDKEQKIVIDKKNAKLKIGWLEFKRKE